MSHHTRSEHTELGEILEKIPTPPPTKPAPTGFVVTGPKGEKINLTEKPPINQIRK